MQLHLFPTVLKFIELEAPNSPQKAFYRLRLEECQGIYLVIKESGTATNNKVLDRRNWQFNKIEQAIKKYDRILRDKLNPARSSPRKYKKSGPPRKTAFYHPLNPFTNDSNLYRSERL